MKNATAATANPPADELACARSTPSAMRAHVASGTPHPDDHREHETGHQVQDAFDRIVRCIDTDRAESEGDKNAHDRSKRGTHAIGRLR